MSSHASNRSAKYCFECVNRYLLHTSLLSQIPKRSYSPAAHTLAKNSGLSPNQIAQWPRSCYPTSIKPKPILRKGDESK
jgi:hypothetical protein